MKATIKLSVVNTFKPFEISFTFEDEEEYRAFNRMMSMHLRDVFNLRSTGTTPADLANRRLNGILTDLKQSWDNGLMFKDQTVNISRK